MPFMKRILDSSFRYQPSYATDVKKTFAKVRQNRREAGLKEPERAKEVKVIVLDRLKLVGER
jgi:hypothetical protein